MAALRVLGVVLLDRETGSAWLTSQAVTRSAASAA